MTSTTTTTTVQRWPDGTVEEDAIAIEEPLEIRVEGRPVAVTMRTPGHDLDLAAGFLYTEGVIDGPDDLQGLAIVADNTVDAVLAGGVQAHREALRRATREIYASSSCGMCGKASIDRIHVYAPPLDHRLEVDPALLVTLPGRLREAQIGFEASGGLHAAALFGSGGDLEVVREDVGRHNAVDKVLGWRLRRDTVPVDDRILLISSRAGFEIVQKALVARIPVIAAVGAPSSLAVELARDSGVTLVGFLRDGRFNTYA